MVGISFKMEQRMMLAPPIASTVEEVVANARGLQRRSFDEESLGLIRDYVKSENKSKPYTDRQILDYLLNSEVYALDLGNIAKAREQLGIANPNQRRA